MKKKVLFLSFAVALLSLVGFQKKEQKREEFILLKIITKLNDKQFKEVKKASVEDRKGFKYVIKDLKPDGFKKFISTSSDQKITKEDEEKIKAIIQKYS